MRGAITLCLALAAGPAAAAPVPDGVAGLYGDAADRALSCAENPHELSFLPSPPHAFLIWSKPAMDASGRLRTGERYDLLEARQGELVLRLEGESRRTDDGGLPIWIMRFTAEGYCWGRTDWPVVRCERPQVRCWQPVS
ncbi:MAG: hypothetical protein ACKVPY_13105 [Paracoccaceae bacterium]